MALPHFEPYIFDPESEPENETAIVTEASDQSINWFNQTDGYYSEADAPSEEDECFSEEEEKSGKKKKNKSSDDDWVPEADDAKPFSSEDDSGEGEREEEEEGEGELEVERKPPQKKQLCTDCGAFYLLPNHVCEHITKPYACNICGKRCVTLESLHVHNKIHNDSYQHFCKYCYSTFQTKLDKLSHENIHENEPKPYKCPDCSEVFARFVERRSHMNIHKGRKEFKCDICGSSVRKKQRLRHMMIHTGEKPFKCSICERTFNQRSHLKSHMRLHTGEQPFKCQHCDKSFTHNVSLKSHLQRYHSVESGSSHEETNKGENVQENETEEHKLKKNSSATGRPKGRPKKQVPTENIDFPMFNVYGECTYETSSDESQDTDDDGLLDDLQNRETLKRKRDSNSDSDYDPNTE